VNSLCSQCGDPATWLVTVPYQPGERAGRLLVRCDRCQDAATANRGVAVPLEVLNTDPDRFLAALYEHGFTQSDPNLAADVIGLPPGRWTRVAQAFVDADGD
jgi:hypothetical protein